MSTIASRLHDCIQSTPGPQALTRGIVLSLSDAILLDRLIADLCQEETSCEYCETRLCESCAVGDRGDTDGCFRGHCTACWDECRTCRDNAADDAGMVGL